MYARCLYNERCFCIKEKQSSDKKNNIVWAPPSDRAIPARVVFQLNDPKNYRLPPDLTIFTKSAVLTIAQMPGDFKFDTLRGHE
jgi:hypothetical protein